MNRAAQQGSDVLVIGGGIMGASSAFFLARRGQRATLLERGLVGQQASGVNFGNVRRQGRPLFELPLANRASATWRQARELLGEEVEYLQRGHLRVCYRNQPELESKLEVYAAEARACDLQLEILGREQLRRRFPVLGPEVQLGSLSPLDGHANPRLAAPAFARAALRTGAIVHEQCEIVRVEKRGADFAVHTADDRHYSAPALLIAAGAWSHHLSAQFGEPVPLTTRGPTMSVTEPVPYAVEPSIGVYTAQEMESVYFRQIPRGNVIIGGSTRGAVDPVRLRAPVYPAHSHSQWQQIQRLAPALGRLQIIRVWSGIESYLPDGLPVMGPSQRVDGLFYAFGFCGSGFQVGPGVGETMAELISTGTTSVAPQPWRVARFAQSIALE
jgi:sarcosine oxidase subunit beta